MSGAMLPKDNKTLMPPPLTQVYDSTIVLADVEAALPTAPLPVQPGLPPQKPVCTTNATVAVSAEDVAVDSEFSEVKQGIAREITAVAPRVKAAEKSNSKSTIQGNEQVPAGKLLPRFDGPQLQFPLPAPTAATGLERRHLEFPD